MSSRSAAPQRDAREIASLRLRLLDSGYAPLPVAGKVPAIGGWQNFTKSPPDEATIYRWQKIRPNATGTGIVCGSIRVIDVDVDDPTLAQRCRQVIEAVIGDLPCVRFGRLPRFAVFCRSADPLAGKRRLPCASGTIEWIGCGGQVVVDGVHPGTGRFYHWLNDPLWETPPELLPILSSEQEAALAAAFDQILGGHIAPPREPVRQSAEDSPCLTADAVVPEGHRNRFLFKRLCNEALSLDRTEDLLQRAAQLNLEHFNPPLPKAEVERTARSVASYKARGELYSPSQAHVQITRAEFDYLRANRDALLLYLHLKFSHGASPNKNFAIVPEAMRKNLPMGKGKIRQARDYLHQTGFLIQTHSGGGKGNPHRYRFRLQS